MGVIYTGRYRQLSGIVNKSIIQDYAPPLMPANGSWFYVPYQGLTSTNADKLAVTTYAVGSAPSVFVYRLSPSTNIPDKLIAEIPCPLGFTYTPDFVKVSPSGRYLAVRWSQKIGINSPTYSIHMYEIKEDSVEDIGFGPYISEYFDWIGENDNFIYALFTQEFNGSIIYCSAPKAASQPFRHTDPAQFQSIYVMSNKHYMIRGVKCKVYEVDSENKTITHITEFPDEIAAAPEGHSVAFHPLQEGDDAYIVKIVSRVISATERYYRYELHAFSGGQFYSFPRTVEKNGINGGGSGEPRPTFYSTGSAIVFKSITLPRDNSAYINQVFSIDDGLKPVSASAQLSNQIDMVYNKSRDRLLAVDHTKVTAYPVTADGIKMPPKDSGLRLNMALTEKLGVTTSAYPTSPRFVASQLQMVSGVPAAAIGTLEIDTLNHFDFMTTEGIVEFWWKFNGEGTVFRFGNLHLYTTSSGGAAVNMAYNGGAWSGSSSFSLAPPGEWRHFLFARNKKYMDVYLDGTLSYSAREVDTKQPPVGAVNNSVATFAKSFFRDIRVTSGNASNLRHQFVSLFQSPGFEPNDYQLLKGKAWETPPGGKIVRL